MEYKFDINREDLYLRSGNQREVIKTRLTEMAEIGMEEIGVANFGIKDIMSGLYIERVWSYSDKNWKEYMDWVRAIKLEKVEHDGTFGCEEYVWDISKNKESDDEGIAAITNL